MAARVSDDSAQMAKMRTLVRWVQTEGGLQQGGRQNAKLDAISAQLSITRDQLNRYLAPNKAGRDMAQVHLTVAQGMRTLLADRTDLPPHIIQISDDFYGEPLGGYGGKALESARVVHHKALFDQSQEDVENSRNLIGLNLVTRRANESLPAPSEDNPEAEIKGWSVALLNVIPPYIQSGDYHPLFKLRQVSKNNHEVVIEGVVVARSDRILLQGIETKDSRAFTATIAVDHERWRDYRSLDRARMTPARGVMLGLSSSKAPFAGPFLSYAIPGSVLPKNPSPEDQSLFDGLHQRAREALGVRNLTETVEAMRQLGVNAESGQLEDMRDRAQQSQLFTLF